jgi:hypothetical protein
MSRGIFKLGNWIGGRSTAPILLPGVSAQRYLDNINPFTQEVVNLVPLSSELDVNAAVQSAKETFPIWSQIPKQERAEYLFNIANEIEKNFEVTPVSVSLYRLCLFSPQETVSVLRNSLLLNQWTQENL